MSQMTQKLLYKGIVRKNWNTMKKRIVLLKYKFKLSTMQEDKKVGIECLNQNRKPFIMYNSQEELEHNEEKGLVLV